MENPNVFRTVGVVAAVIVVLGLIVIGSQYLGSITSGAGAAVIDIEELPQEITVDRDSYWQMLNLVDQYFIKTDLATKNIIIQDLQDLLSSLR